MNVVSVLPQVGPNSKMIQVGGLKNFNGTNKIQNHFVASNVQLSGRPSLLGVLRQGISRLLVIAIATGWMWMNVTGILHADQDSSFHSIERSVAQSQQVYLVIHPEKQVMWIKARGISLGKFPIQSTKWMGNPVSQSSIFSIEDIRPHIKPPEIVPRNPGQHDPQELLKPLTVSDMPIHFEIFFQDGCSLMIQSIRTTSVFVKHWDAFEGWVNRTFVNLKIWIQQLAGVRSSRLVLEMTPTEVQRLYWALVPSTRIIVHSGE